MAQAIEIQLVPLSELGDGQAAYIRNECIKIALGIVSKELKMDPGKLVVRDIQPGVDLGYPIDSWDEITGATANAYETMASGTIADMRFVALYGIKDDSSEVNVSKVKVNVGGSDKTVWQLEALYGVNGDARVGLAPTPVLLPQNKPYTISRYVLNTYGPAHIVLKGFVIEPRGRTISP